MKKDPNLERLKEGEERAKELFKQHFPDESKIFNQKEEERERDQGSVTNSAVWHGFKIALGIIAETKSGFHIEEDSPDDLTLYHKGKAILNISLPEQSTQWNTRLP